MLRKTSARATGIIFAAVLACIAVVFPVSLPGASASTSISFDFDSNGQLTNGFNSYVSYGTIVQSATGGIGNSGAINVSSQSADGVFTSKASYSIGPVGSSYTFSAFMQSVGNGGYSGMGFTSLAPAAGNVTSNPAFRPSDALGISVHGGGFIFHNGTNNPSGSWNQDNAGIVTIKKSSSFDLLNSGSPSRWYKVFLIITRDSATTFDMRVEVWPSNADGTLIRPSEADAIFELQNQTNSTLTNAASIRTYLNFSGNRVYYFDNYQVALAGGSSVIQDGTPVVLTANAALQNTAVVALDGSVPADGGRTVTERGFVYSLSPDPTINDFKVPSGTGTGSFTEFTPNLPNGTYYFRAYATNATGTSYGVTKSVTIAGSSVQAAPAASTPTVSTPSTQLANTGSPERGNWLVAVSLGLLFAAGLSLTIVSRRRS